jgi:hypothetical protein
METKQQGWSVIDTVIWTETDAENKEQAIDIAKSMAKNLCHEMLVIHKVFPSSRFGSKGPRTINTVCDSIRIAP